MVRLLFCLWLPLLVIGWAQAADAESEVALEYESLAPDAEPLRSQFNADIGKTRVVMLAAPT